MNHIDMEPFERQTDSEQSGQADMLQALRSASLPDDFWMYSYKILPCPHGYRHSWTHCPFSHVGETARRRCPRTHSYFPDPCINARAKRQCPNGDACPYAHNTFEQWLHPARYRTRLCYLGANCRRPTCFFAHSVEELRSVEESDGVAAPPPPPSGVMSAPLPSLSIPPPVPSLLPSPSSSVMPSASGSSGDYGPSGGVAVEAQPLAAVHAGAPLGLVHPLVFMGIPPQPHQALRPDMLHSSGAVQCFVRYEPRPTVLHPSMAMPSAAPPSLQVEPGALQPVPVHTIQMPPPGSAQMAAVPVAGRPPPRPHIATPTGAMAVAAVHHPASIHLAPAGALFLQSSMPPAMSTSGPLQGPPPPPPPPQPPTYQSPFIWCYHRIDEGAPAPVACTAAGRARSYSNPGEVAYRISTASRSALGATRTCEQPPVWERADVFRRATAAGGFPSAAATAAPSPRTAFPGPVQSGARSGGGAGGATAAAAPRHMPAPTNRSGAARRMSTPACESASAAAAAMAADAAAAAALTGTKMRYQGRSVPPESSPLVPSASGSFPDPQGHKQQQGLAFDGMHAALRSLSLTKSVTAPPPTPAVSHVARVGEGGGRGGSPYTLSSSSSSVSSSPLSAAIFSAVGSPSATMALGGIDADVDGAVQADMALLVARSSVDGPTRGNVLSRPSSSGSGTSTGTLLSACNSGGAATATSAVLAAATGSVDGTPNAVAAAVAAAAGPYRALLQHVLRSASASAAEPPPLGLIPTLLNGSGSDVNAVHTDLYFDEADMGFLERSSDPGPMGLHAAVRRISTEFGAAATCRNSDPGQDSSLPRDESEVQQVLLPLLQSVLSEGLATGQFELVNGQLLLKGGAGGGPGSFVVPRAAAAAAVAATMGLPIEPTPCAAGAGARGLNA